MLPNTSSKIKWSLIFVVLCTPVINMLAIVAWAALGRPEIS